MWVCHHIMDTYTIYLYIARVVYHVEKTKPYVRVHAAILGDLIQVEDKEVWNKTASKESQFIINLTFNRNWNMRHFYQRGIILIFPLWVLFIYLSRLISFYVYTLPSFILFAIRQQQKMFQLLSKNNYSSHIRVCTKTPINVFFTHTSLRKNI